MSRIQNAVDFLLGCLEYSADEDLTEIETYADAAIQAEGYRESFGDELPELLADPYWMEVCWNRAVKAETKRRKLEAEKEQQAEIVLGGPFLSFEISECGASLEAVIEKVEREWPGWRFDHTEAAHRSCLMAVFTKN